MDANWMVYDRLMEQKEKEDYIIMTEAEKHYRQSVANYEATKRERKAFNQGIEEYLKGMERIGENTAQSNHESRNVIS